MKNKLITIFILVIMLIFTFTINSYASTDFSFSFTEKGLDYSDISNVTLEIEPNFILFYITTNSAYLYISENPFYLTTEGNYCTLHLSNTYYSFSYSSKRKTWDYRFNSYDFNMSVQGFIKNEINETFLYSNFDLMCDDDVVIYAYGSTPLSITAKSINNYNDVMKEVVYILPVVLTVVIGLIGIRKAISFVRKKLRNS